MIRGAGLQRRVLQCLPAIFHQYQVSSQHGNLETAGRVGTCAAKWHAREGLESGTGSFDENNSCSLRFQAESNILN